MRRHRHPEALHTSAERHRPSRDASLPGLLVTAALALAIPLVLVALSHPALVASFTVGLGGLVVVLARN